MNLVFKVLNISESRTAEKDLISKISDLTADCPIYHHKFSDTELSFFISGSVGTMYEIIDVLNDWDSDIIQMSAYAERDFN
ncbi:MAG: hypothetical protein ABIN80_28590 [Dyadobacter sp.]